MRKSKLAAMLMASLVLLYTACSEKEEPLPVEDSARVDALRTELRMLNEQLYGTQGTNGVLEEENEELSEDVAWYEAEIARLQAIYDKDVQYQVIAIDFQGNPIVGASVTLNQNGELATVTADNNGVATFTDVRAGYLTAVVKATGFATANYSTTLADINNNEANTRVPLLPKSGTQAESAMFTLTGTLYANLNLANDTTDAVGDKPMGGNTTYNKMTDKKLVFKPYIGEGNIPFSGTGAGQIRNLAYEDAAYMATFDATTGKYTVMLPVESIYEGINFWFEVSAEEFAADLVLPYDGDYKKTYMLNSVFRFEDDSYYTGGKLAGSTYTWNLFYNDGHYN